MQKRTSSSCLLTCKVRDFGSYICMKGGGGTETWGYKLPLDEFRLIGIDGLDVIRDRRGIF